MTDHFIWFQISEKAEQSDLTCMYVFCSDTTNIGLDPVKNHALVHHQLIMLFVNTVDPSLSQTIHFEKKN